jgi:hypothetical protein
MSKKIELTGNYVVVTDTVTSEVVYESPRSKVRYHRVNIDQIRLYSDGARTHHSNTLLTDDSSFVDGADVAISDIYVWLRGYTGAPAEGAITVTQKVLNYSALAPGTVVGELAYVEESQGTPWLPGTIGGTYYPAGWYLWDGADWVSDRNAIAEQLEALMLEDLEDVRAKDNTIEGDIDFNGNNIQNLVGLNFNAGQTVVWNDDFKTIDIPTGTGSTLQVGQEFYFLIYNDTGVQIDNGSIVKPVAGFPVGGEVLPTVILARADNHETCEGTLFMATSDIGIGSVGMATRLGRVGGLNLSSYSLGDDLYLSPTVAGGVTNVRPTFPNYTITIGGVINNDAVNGIVGYNVTRNVQDTILNSWDGAVRENFDFTVSSDGATITGALEQSGGGDLTMIFSDGLTTFDCTPAATIALTAGTDTNPQVNYVYIPVSTKVLTVSTSDFPETEHVKIANVILRSASATQTDDAIGNRNWNDHIKHSSNNGHLLHIAEKLRQEHASWHSGAEGSVSIVGASTPDDVYASITSGKVYQLHKQDIPAQDMSSGDHAHVVNDFTSPYNTITNLNTLLTDSQNNSMSGNFFSLVLWGVCNKSGEGSHLMINLPNNSYANNNNGNAVNDVNNYSVYDIPTSFRGLGFLIARFTFQHSASGGGQWTLIDTEDLRGKLPNTSAGGSAGGSGVTTFQSLTDTPSSYSGNADKLPAVNAGETSLEYIFVGLANLKADLKTRVTANVATSYAIDHSLGNVFELTMTGATTFTDSNLPTGTDTKDFIIVLDGNFVPTWNVYYEATPASDPYDGTVRNLIIVSVINGTGSSEDVIYQIENLST